MHPAAQHTFVKPQINRDLAYWLFLFFCQCYRFNLEFLLVRKYGVLFLSFSFFPLLLFYYSLFFLSTWQREVQYGKGYKTRIINDRGFLTWITNRYLSGIYLQGITLV
jgi:hypothetical protein